MRAKRAAVAALLAMLLFPANAPAAGTGLAWDSVTKMSMGADAASLAPGSFADDFAAASSAKGSGPQAFMAFMQSGLAERHYIGGSKERTDQVAAQSATILDCAARTITTLDLAKKTYRVTPMEQPGTPGSQGRSGGSSSKDEGMKVAVSVDNKSLGARQVGGEATNGYSSAMAFTETQASGESRTQNAQLVGYYAGFPMPASPCALPASSMNPRSMSPGQGFGMISSVSSHLLDMLKKAGIDPRFSIKQSGPALPLSSFAMYQAMSFEGYGGRAPSFITERGNVRPIDAGDPIFSVPADFTQQK